MLPNAEHAVVEDAKVRDYLLSDRHPVGRFKSVVFRALGYGADEWSLLASDLLSLAREGEAELDELTSHGQKYVVSGNLQGPNGRVGRFKSIWIARTGEKFVRFITAVPE